MTDPNKTNEDINEELSIDELKRVSGGVILLEKSVTGIVIHEDKGTMGKGNGPHGTGSGMTRVDWEMTQGIAKRNGSERYKKQG